MILSVIPGIISSSKTETLKARLGSPTVTMGISCSLNNITFLELIMSIGPSGSLRIMSSPNNISSVISATRASLSNFTGPNCSSHMAFPHIQILPPPAPEAFPSVCGCNLGLTSSGICSKIQGAVIISVAAGSTV